MDWKAVDEDLLAFVARLVRLRRSSPVLRQEAFFEGHEIPGRRAAPATSPGSRPDGGQLTTADWFDTGLQTLGMYLDGRGIRHRDEHGRPVVDDSYLVQLHAGPEPVTVQLPGPPWADGYELRACPPSTRPASRRSRPSWRPAPSSSPPAGSGCSGSSAGRDAASTGSHRGPGRATPVAERRRPRGSGAIGCSRLLSPAAARR